MGGRGAPLEWLGPQCLSVPLCTLPARTSMHLQACLTASTSARRTRDIFKCSNLQWSGAGRRWRRARCTSSAGSGGGSEQKQQQRRVGSRKLHPVWLIMGLSSAAAAGGGATIFRPTVPRCGTCAGSTFAFQSAKQVALSLGAWPALLLMPLTRKNCRFQPRPVCAHARWWVFAEHTRQHVFHARWWGLMHHSARPRQPSPCHEARMSGSSVIG